MRHIQKVVSVALLIMIFLLLPMILTAEDSSQGVINGRVINKNLDNKGMEGLEIILHPYVEKKELEVRRSKTDRTGFFSFQGVSIDHNRAYQLSTKYKDVEYYSQAMQFKERKELASDFSVYETTDQDNDIFIKMHHIFLEKDNDSFWIKETMIVENQGDRVYVRSKEAEPGSGEPLRVSLPKEAYNLQFEQHMTPFVVKTAEGFIDSRDIKPGTKRILFSYMVDSVGLNYKFVKSQDNGKRLFFQKNYNYSKKTRRVHLHLTNPETNVLKRNVTLREYLKRNPKIAKEYMKIKKQGVNLAKGEGKIYQNHKKQFLTELNKIALKEVK